MLKLGKILAEWLLNYTTMDSNNKLEIKIRIYACPSRLSDI